MVNTENMEGIQESSIPEAIIRERERTRNLVSRTFQTGAELITNATVVTAKVTGYTIGQALLATKEFFGSALRGWRGQSIHGTQEHKK